MRCNPCVSLGSLRDTHVRWHFPCSLGPCSLLRDFPLPFCGQTPITQTPGSGRIRRVPFAGSPSQTAPAGAQGLSLWQGEEGDGFPKRVSLAWWRAATWSGSGMLEPRWVCAWPGFGPALKRLQLPLELGRRRCCGEQPRGGDAGK